MDCFCGLPKVVLFSETSLTFMLLVEQNYESMNSQYRKSRDRLSWGHRGSLSPSRPTAGSVPYSRHCFLLHSFQLPGQSTKHTSVDAIHSIPSLNKNCQNAVTAICPEKERGEEEPVVSCFITFVFVWGRGKLLNASFKAASSPAKDSKEADQKEKSNM